MPMGQVSNLRPTRYLAAPLLVAALCAGLNAGSCSRRALRSHRDLQHCRPAGQRRANGKADQPEGIKLIDE
jgi:hypothetical protein